MKYTLEEEEKLRMLWPTAEKIDDICMAFPFRTHAALSLKAAAMGLKAFPRHRRAVLENMLPDTIQNWYWYGFLLADGYFSNRGELSITINVIDIDHLTKLGNHICATVRHLNPSVTTKGTERQHVRLSAMNSVVVEQIKSKLGLSSAPKTVNPPDIRILEAIDNDLLTALFIGFFDGDGCMRNKGYGQIVCHGSWLEVLKLFQNKNLVKNVKYDNNGRASCVMSVTVGKHLKNFPVEKLERKWSKVK